MSDVYATLPPGRALDALVAEKVMGKPAECYLIGTGTLGDPIRLNIPDAVWRVRSSVDNYWECWSPDGAARVVNDFAVPRYSTDIVAAWEVVEKVKEFGLKVQWERHGWVCYFDHEDYLYGTGSYLWAPTAPHAICLATLKAKGML